MFRDTDFSKVEGPLQLFRRVKAIPRTGEAQKFRHETSSSDGIKRLGNGAAHKYQLTSEYELLNHPKSIELAENEDRGNTPMFKRIQNM
ncbi:MAG: hypothetical protein M1818_005174 [Claussenomyces sp. TS43310]|nr:MAG: hypothetical protein M1818_005174 [Claussenomyces sp. TS43310]